MAIEDDLALRVIRPTILMDLVLDDGERNFWTGTYAIEANGKTYLGLPGMDGGISILQTLSLEDLSGDIQLSGVQPELLAISLNDDFQNRTARIYIATLTEAGLLSSSRLEFTGSIEDIRIQEGPNNPSLEILIRGSFADLESGSNIAYSAADQAKVDADDTFFTFLQAAQEAEPPFAS